MFKMLFLYRERLAQNLKVLVQILHNKIACNKLTFNIYNNKGQNQQKRGSFPISNVIKKYTPEFGNNPVNI